MNHKKRGSLGVMLLVVLAFTVGTAEAKYRYGNYGSYGGSGQPGFFVQLEGALANPRNTDNVIATTAGSNSSPIVPDWDDEVAGRLGLGYEFASGNRLTVSVWGFNAETRGAGSQSILLAVGPPISAGDSGTSFDVTTEITAQTADLAWSRAHEIGERFTMDWSLGLRYANFEETVEGVYGGVGGGGSSYNAAKSNEGDMVGVRAAATGTYRASARFSVSGSLGVSFLDGESTASSSLTQTGLVSPASSSSLVDDSRSGAIRDFAVAANWHFSDDRLRVFFGWEQQRWDDIATDLVRNFPTTSAPLRDRDSVVFSGYKLGLYYRF